MSGSQIQLFKDFSPDQLQSYIDKIQEIKNADYGQSNAFESTAYLDYANALSEVDAKQAALLLSTQGLSNAQIQQTLAAKGLTAEEQYQSMADAGLLAARQKLSNVELQSVLTSQLGSEAKAKETMESMKLSIATEGEEAQTVQLTAKKLALAVSNGVLTKEEAELLAMTLGVSVAQKAQAASVIPQWIVKMKAMALATWEQVKATAVWLASNPAGWCLAAGAALAVLYKIWKNNNVTLEEARDRYKETASELESVESELADVNSRIDELLAKDTLTLTDENDLKRLKEENEELKIRKAILDAQKADEASELNRKIEDRYDKTYSNGTEITFIDENGDHIGLSGEEYLKNRIAYAKHLVGLNRELTDQEKEDFQAIRSYALEQGQAIIDLTDGYEAVTGEEKARKAGWDAILSDIAYLADNEAGTIPDITGRLKEKFADGVSVDDTSTLSEGDREIAAWIDSLSDEDKKIMLKCGLDDASLDDLKQYLAEQKEEIFNSEPSLLSTSGILSQVQALSDGLGQLSKIYADVCDQEGFDWSSILNNSTFEETFGSLGSAYDNFLETVSSSPDNIEACQSAFDSLATAYIKDSGALDNLTEDTKAAATAMLEQMGVANADDIVTDALAQKKEELALNNTLAANSSMNLDDVTASEITNLLNEGIIADQTSQKMAAFALQKQYANKDTLYTTADCQNLYQLASMAGASGKALEKLNALKGRLYNADGTSKIISDAERSNIQNAINNIVSDVAKASSATLKIPQLKNNGGSSGTSSKETSTASQTKTTFNFIETALSRIEQLTDRISKKASATYKSYKYRNNALAQELDLLKQQQQMQKDAYDTYMEKANAVGLDESLAARIRSGDTDIVDVTDDTLAEQINEYTKYYEAALNCVDAVQDLRDQIAALAKTRFDMITEQYDNYLSAIEHRQNAIDNDIELAEAQNKIAGTSFYEALIAQENQRLSNLNAEYEKLTQAMDEAVASGYITKGSDMWYDMKQQINAVSESIQQSNLNLIQFQNSLKAVQKLIFDATESQYDSALGLLSGEMNILDSAVSLIQTSGHLAAAGYYDQLITAAEASLDTNAEKLAKLEEELPDIEPYTDEWFDASDAIDAARSAVIDAQNAVIKYNDAIRELDWTIFDRTQSAVTGLAAEHTRLAELFSFNQNDLYNDNGTPTDRGLAVQALHLLNYQAYTKQAKLYADEISLIQTQLQNDSANTTLLERYDQLIEAQQQTVANINAEKSAIKELVSQGYDRLLDTLSSLTQQYRDTLSARKDLYDYQQQIQDLTQTRDTYQKQLNAYAGDTSEETQALIQQITQKLKEAQQALADAQYDQYVTDQQKLLDTLNDDLREWVNARLDDIDNLMKQTIDTANANAASIAGAIQTEAAGLGITLSSAEQSLLKLLQIFDADADTEDPMGDAVSDTIGNIGQTIRNLPTTLDKLLGSDSPVSGLLNNIYRIINEMNEAIFHNQPQVEEASYDFSDDDDDDDNDDDYEPTATVGAGSSTSQTQTSSGSSSKSKSSDSSYSYDVTGDNSTQHFSITASNQDEADQKMQDYVDDLNKEDDDGGYDYNRRAILTPLERGDSVLTKDETDNIYNWGKLSPEVVLSRLSFTPYFPFSSSLPDIPAPETNINSDIEMNITLPNVSNYTEFVDQLQKDRRFEKIVQAMTIGNALGKNSYSKMKY